MIYLDAWDSTVAKLQFEHLRGKKKGPLMENFVLDMLGKEAFVMNFVYWKKSKILKATRVDFL